MTKYFICLLICYLKIGLTFGQTENLTLTYEYVKPYGNVKLDTTIKNVKFIKTDGKNYQLKYDWQYCCWWNKETVNLKEDYSFNLSDKKKAFQYDYEEDSIVKNELLFIDSIEFTLIGNNYSVYKYLYDLDYSIDEEMLLFFSPEYGIIMKNSVAWAGYTKLLDYRTEKDKIILNKICEIILYRSSFFNNAYKRMPTEMEKMLDELKNEK